MRESFVLNWTMEFLAMHQDKIMFWRNNTGQLMVGRRVVKFGCPGSPDIIGLSNGWMFGVELKGKGGVVSDAQKAWSKRFIKNGGLYVVVERQFTQDEVHNFLHENLIKKLLI